MADRKEESIEEMKEDLIDLENYIEEFSMFLPLAVCTVSPNGIITDVNRAFSELTHYSEMEIIGNQVEYLFTDREAWRALEDKIPKEKLIESKELVLIEKTKKEIPVSISVAKREDREGNFIGYFVAITDITERKEMEVKEKKRTAELEKFTKLAVGRELKMIELKKKVKELEGLVSKK